jgi:chorismate mutase-like protein
MKTRDELRAEIDEIDDRLLELFNERAKLAIEIAKLKERNGAPILDPEREREVVGRACAANRGPLRREAVARIFRTLMRESRAAQSKAVSKALK